MFARFRALAMPVVLAAVVLAAAAAACGSHRPATPEELFAAISRHNEAGEIGKIWDLLTDEERQHQRRDFAAFREYMRRNPDPDDKLHLQFHCTREEIQTLSDEELFRRQNMDTRRALIGARIVDRRTDPARPEDVLLIIDTPSGPRVHLRARHVEDGWALAELMNVEPR